VLIHPILGGARVIIIENKKIEVDFSFAAALPSER
jgi:hypothetical protein